MREANTDNIFSKLWRTGLGHIFGANTINQIIVFASSFILIRILSKGEYGVFSYAFNIYSFFTLANGFAMDSAALQICSEVEKDRGKADAYLKFGILFGSGWNIILGFLIVVVSCVCSFSLDGAGRILVLFAGLPLLTMMFSCIQVYFRCNLLNVKYSKCTVINTVLITFGSVVGACLFRTTGLVLFRVLAVALSIVIGIIVYKFPLMRIMHAVRISYAEKIDMLKLAAISMINLATGQLLYLIDVFLIGMIFSDERMVASYKTATLIPNALLFIPAALVVYIYPYFARNKDDKVWVKEKFFILTKYFTLFNAVIVFFLVVFAPLIIRIVFGKQYLDAVSAFRILSISYFFSATFRKIIGNLLITQRKLNVNFWVGFMEVLLNIISNWILIHLFGSIGAAITTLIICIISSLVLTLYFVRYLNRDPKV